MLECMSERVGSVCRKGMSEWCAQGMSDGMSEVCSRRVCQGYVGVVCHRLAAHPKSQGMSEGRVGSVDTLCTVLYPVIGCLLSRANAIHFYYCCHNNRCICYSLNMQLQGDIVYRKGRRHNTVKLRPRAHMVPDVCRKYVGQGDSW